MILQLLYTNRTLHSLSYKWYTHISCYTAGNVVSTRKEELLAVLDHCSIQIDNPVSILSQDTSRNFLQKATPSDKFKLFMKATQLEQIATDYEKAKEDQELMSEGIKRQQLVSFCTCMLTHIRIHAAWYRIAGKFGGELNLAVLRSMSQPPN